MASGIPAFCLLPVSESKCQWLPQYKFIDYQPQRRCMVRWRAFHSPDCRRLFPRRCWHWLALYPLRVRFLSAYRLDIFWLAAKAANVPEHIYRGNLAPGKRGLLARPRDQVHSPLSLSLGKRDSPKKKNLVKGRSSRWATVSAWRWLVDHFNASMWRCWTRRRMCGNKRLFLRGPLWFEAHLAA